MDPRLAAADAAFKANRPDEGVALLIQALSDNPKGAAGAYRVLAATLFSAGRHDEARRWAEAGLEHHPREFDLWNVLGVAHRRLQNPAAALKALDQAQKLNPKSQAPLINRTNVLNDLGDPRAVETALKLVRQTPGNAEFHRMAGVAYRIVGDWEKSRSRFETAIRLRPKLVQAWSDLCSLESAQQNHEAALKAMERGLAANPGDTQLLEARVILLRRAGQYAQAEQALQAVLAADDTAAWAHYQLGRTVADADRARANIHFRRAVELKPDNTEYRMTLLHSLDRTRTGNEGENIQEAYEQLTVVMQQGRLTNEQHLFMAYSLLQRVGDFSAMKRLGSFAELGRRWAQANNHAVLLSHLGRVETPEDRHELLEQHRIWGRQSQATASKSPIVRPPRRARADGKIRLGFISSDLRNHPVGYFALPLFDHLNPRFELYCYSFYRGAEDGAQKYIASKSTFRWRPTISEKDAAQMIADDELDLLIELGGSTHMNKLDVLAYKPARLQASWLGYPHSAGLETIDYIVVDPYMKPEDPRLLIEKPMVMPHTWLSFGRGQFRDDQPIDPQIPQDRTGVITFGTFNNPHKYGPEVLRTWAKIVASVPKAEFLFVRPEGNTARFRENLLSYFIEAGVEPERVRFTAIRGNHLQYYNQIDIALDPFPLTGGTTTCETVWMGTPVVSLVGAALFERLSYSVLTNAGLGDLAVRTLDDYVATALKLADDVERRRHLRLHLREQIKQSPLGQTEAFAGDFYDLVAETLRVAG